MAGENNKKQNEVWEILKEPALLAIGVILVALYLLVGKIIPALGEYGSLQKTYKESLAQYSQKEQELEDAKRSAEAAKAAPKPVSALAKEFFKPLDAGADSESIIASEFSEILQLMMSNAIKTRSVKYTYDPPEDNFIKGANGKYSVCKLDMQMIANYNNFKNFIKDLYKHEHYLDIAKIEIVPYEKNKSILLIDLQLKLYAEKI